MAEVVYKRASLPKQDSLAVPTLWVLGPHPVAAEEPLWQALRQVTP